MMKAAEIKNTSPEYSAKIPEKSFPLVDIGMFTGPMPPNSIAAFTNPSITGSPSNAA